MAMLSSIVIPLLLGSLQLLIQSPRAISRHWQKSGLLAKFAIIMLAVPFYPIYFMIQEVVLTEASKDYIVPLDTLTEAKYYMAQYAQVDIGLESHFQLIIAITLLLLANSQTNAISGLETLFENERLFYMNPKVALGISISWSLFSCIKSQIKGMAKKRQHATTMANVLLLIFTSTSIALRVFSSTLYLTPALGLFNTLRHLQGEMYPYWDPYFRPGDINNSVFYFGKAPPMNWTQITRWNYIERENAEPPQTTLYTYFTIEQYLGAFICILALQFVFHLALKILTNPLVFKKLFWIDCVIHSITCCFVPCPMEEWDSEKGTVAMHKARKNLVLKEMLAAMLLNFCVNLFILTPLIILGKYQESCLLSCKNIYLSYFQVRTFLTDTTFLLIPLEPFLKKLKPMDKSNG